MYQENCGKTLSRRAFSHALFFSFSLHLHIGPHQLASRIPELADTARIPHVRKLTPESLALGDSRHQLYVTLQNASYSQGRKTAGKNVQVCVGGLRV